MGYIAIMDFSHGLVSDYLPVSNEFPTRKQILEDIFMMLIEFEEEYNVSLVDEHMKKLCDTPMCVPYHIKLGDQWVKIIILPSIRIKE